MAQQYSSVTQRMLSLRAKSSRVLIFFYLILKLFTAPFHMILKVVYRDTFFGIQYTKKVSLSLFNKY